MPRPQAFDNLFDVRLHRLAQPVLQLACTRFVWYCFTKAIRAQYDEDLGAGLDEFEHIKNVIANTEAFAAVVRRGLGDPFP